MVNLARRSTRELIVALDVLLDSVSQTLIRAKKVTPGKHTRLCYQTRTALRIVRVLMARFNADRILTMRRCMNRDELPWEHRRGGGTRGLSRRNWAAFRRRRDRSRWPRLTEFLNSARARSREA